jgi:endonuclease III
MSTQTAHLLGVRRAHRSPWVARLGAVSDRVLTKYGTPTLGNFRDPVKEIFYILLSAKTTDLQYRRTHRALMAAFPTTAALASAKVRAVRRCIESGGLAGKRAAQVVAVARALVVAGGDRPRRYLRRLELRAGYDFLTSLPGVGPKSAFCVLMYSLGFDVFPVDVNVQRIAERLGAIRRGMPHRLATKRLAALSPDGRSLELHVGLVVHGRKICLPRNPKCGECCLLDLCNTGRKKKGGAANERT